MAIRDAEGNELLYWPVTGLVAGGQSDPITVYVDTPQQAELRATESDKLTIFARVDGVGPYTNISEGGLSLALLAGPEREIEMYAEASEDVTTVERVALSVGSSRSGAAEWLSV